MANKYKDLAPGTMQMQNGMYVGKTKEGNPSFSDRPLTGMEIPTPKQLPSLQAAMPAPAPMQPLRPTGQREMTGAEKGRLVTQGIERDIQMKRKAEADAAQQEVKEVEAEPTWWELLVGKKRRDLEQAQ